jgi:hypothetical protein
MTPPALASDRVDSCFRKSNDSEAIVSSETVSRAGREKSGCLFSSWVITSHEFLVFSFANANKFEFQVLPKQNKFEFQVLPKQNKFEFQVLPKQNKL